MLLSCIEPVLALNFTVFTLKFMMTVTMAMSMMMQRSLTLQFFLPREDCDGDAETVVIDHNQSYHCSLLAGLQNGLILAVDSCLSRRC